MVFYRKYRPQKLSELDSSVVRERLTSVLSSKNIPHAFLFTGPKGLGKTSAARIVAKIVNCEKNSKVKTQKSKLQLKTQNFNSIEPCNKCGQCISITNGTNLDILEIDAASNRGIDEIRDLRDKIRLAPASANKKVYIIDEVHMLTTEAFNALLKTLEEPPSHALFILCTTEWQKVPLTIVSRCFHISFKPAATDELIRSFMRVAKNEKMNIDKQALGLVAGLSDGSFRDGAKILEELSSIFGKKKITKELVETKYKISSIKSEVLQMLNLMAEKNTKEALKLVSQIVEEGTEMKYFISQLISKLHAVLLFKVGVEKEGEVANNPSVDGLEIEDIKKLMELLTRASLELKYAVISQLPLEMAIIEWGMEVGARGPVAGSFPAPRQSSGQASAVYPEQSRRIGSPSTPATPRSLLEQLIEKVKPYNHSVAGLLRGCQILEYDGEKMVIETNYKFHKERLEEAKTRELIEKAGSELTGNSVIVKIIMKAPA